MPNHDSQPMSTRELACRRIQQAGLTLGGERGGRIANRVSGALGLGRIELCDDPTCPNCAPVADD